MTGNERDTGQNGADPRSLAGAYALDAVSAAEAAEFEQAAEASEELRREAQDLQQTAALLGLASTPVMPSARMKNDLMAQIAVTPQLPATTAEAASTPIPTVAPVVGAAETRARARWFARPIGIVIAAVAAIALFVGGGAIGSIINTANTPAAPEASAAALASILAADDSQRASTPIETGGTATLVWSNTLGLSAVLVDELPELPAGKVFEAWYIGESGAAAPAGTFTPSDAGTTWHVLDGTMSLGDIVGVTVEPKGGSDQPTTDPIVVLQSA